MTVSAECTLSCEAWSKLYQISGFSLKSSNRVKSSCIEKIAEPIVSDSKINYLF